MAKKKRKKEVIRVRVPKNDETIGVVTAVLGGGRFKVKCEDGFTRICRIPGKIKKRLWIKPGYLVLIKPWSVQKEERGDVVWLYSRAQAGWLRRKGYVNVSTEF